MASKHRNAGIVPSKTRDAGTLAVRRFLQFLNKPITDHALSELISGTRQQHRDDSFNTDDQLTAFIQLVPLCAHQSYGAYLKGIFKTNRCILQVSIITTPAQRTRKISPGILKGVYEGLPTEYKSLIDLQTYSGERVAAL
ncbi:MAG: hypothetical protein HY297_05075, partial [Thaumarchaeota archaeon]|nr:hypothetical protein [Nitrososphaerota archaeon]